MDALSCAGKEDSGESGTRQASALEQIASIEMEGVELYSQVAGVARQEVLDYSMLHLTAQEGATQAEICRNLEASFGHIDTPITKQGRTALLLAAHHGHKALIHPLLENGADVFCCDKDGDSVLSLSRSHGGLHSQLQSVCEDSMIKAVKRNDIPLVKRALSVGVDVNAKEKDKYGWTALLWACEKNFVEMVKHLLDQGANVNAHDSYDWTGLILSSRKGHVEIVKRLLDKGADINQTTADSKWTALMWTAQEGRTEVARLLLKGGASRGTQDEAGFTPLLQASQDGHLGVVKELVEHDTAIKMDMVQVTNDGWSAVMLASKNGHAEIVHYLVDHGADAHYRKEDGVTALHVASYKGHNSIVHYLCWSKGLEVNAQDRDGITPLMFAAKKSNLDVVRTLVESCCADINLKESSYGWTALYFAAIAPDHRVLEYLLKCGDVELTYRDAEGYSVEDIARGLNPPALALISGYGRVCSTMYVLCRYLLLYPHRTCLEVKLLT